jgi:transposase
MSLRPSPIGPVPEETARVAHAAFPRGSAWMRLRDELGPIYEDATFAALFSRRGRPAEAPWRLALVSVMQFAERLSDRKAADGVRGRIDWKYALGLTLDDPGFDASVLCEFRARLLAGSAEQQLLDALLTLCRDRGWLHARGRQRTDSTHVLAAIRAHNRVEAVRETVRHALNVLAEQAPEWLLQHVQPDWAERYRSGWDDTRLPSKQAERDVLVAQVGADGLVLLTAALSDDATPTLRSLPAIELLRKVWVQNYVPTEGGLRWRTTDDGLPPATQFISSPYDPEAHLALKHATAWIGYKVHLTETCETETPNLITDVQTVLAPIADWDSLPLIHEGLAKRALLPDQHLVDSGYVDADLLVASRRDFGIDLVGPPRGDQHWQAREKTGFSAAHFRIDWEQHRATCPEGRTSVSWSPVVDNRRTEVIKIRFSEKDCSRCPSLTRCVRSKKKYPRRLITVRRQPAYEALRAARDREKTRDFMALYANRSGIEGTVSQGVRTCGLRRTRYRGFAKTHLDHMLTATALNCLRLSDWFAGSSKATTQHSRFARLLALGS